MKLYDTVRLLVDLPEEGLSAGAVGAVVHVFDTPRLSYEIEFADEHGPTIAQVPLTADRIRPVAPCDPDA